MHYYINKGINCTATFYDLDSCYLLNSIRLSNFAQKIAYNEKILQKNIIVCSCRIVSL